MKKVVYVILGLVALYLILALFGAKEIKVERSIVINKPASTVMGHLVDHKFFHDNWSPWTELDPAMKVNYIGNPGESGHSMSWASDVKEVGQGTLTINRITGDSVVQTLAFEGMGESTAYYLIKGKDNTTEVTWGMLMKSPFIMRPMMMFMNMDKMIGGDYEKGLANLKKVIEGMPDVAKYEVQEIEWPESNFVGSKKETVPFTEIGAYFGKNFPAIGEALGKEKIQPLAAPLGIYWAYDEKGMKAEMAAVFKVAPGTKLKGYESYSFPASKVLKVEYYGAYDKSANAHYAIGDYMKSKNIDHPAAVLEEYVTDPMSEKDTAKWLTNIYYVLK